MKNENIFKNCLNTKILDLARKEILKQHHVDLKGDTFYQDIILEHYAIRYSELIEYEKKEKQDNFAIIDLKKWKKGTNINLCIKNPSFFKYLQISKTIEKLFIEVRKNYDEITIHIEDKNGYLLKTNNFECFVNQEEIQILETSLNGNILPSFSVTQAKHIMLYKDMIIINGNAIKKITVELTDKPIFFSGLPLITGVCSFDIKENKLYYKESIFNMQNINIGLSDKATMLYKSLDTDKYVLNKIEINAINNSKTLNLNGTMKFMGDNVIELPNKTGIECSLVDLSKIKKIKSNVLFKYDNYVFMGNDKKQEYVVCGTL